MTQNTLNWTLALSFIGLLILGLFVLDVEAEEAFDRGMAAGVEYQTFFCESSQGLAQTVRAS